MGTWINGLDGSVLAKLKKKRRQSRRKQNFSVCFADQLAQLIEYNPDYSSRSIKEPNFKGEQHSETPWYEKDFKEMPWWDSPDPNEDDELTSSCKKVISEEDYNENEREIMANRIQIIVLIFVLKLQNNSIRRNLLKKVPSPDSTLNTISAKSAHDPKTTPATRPISTADETPTQDETSTPCAKCNNIAFNRLTQLRNKRIHTRENDIPSVNDANSTNIVTNISIANRFHSSMERKIKSKRSTSCLSQIPGDKRKASTKSNVSIKTGTKILPRHFLSFLNNSDTKIVPSSTNVNASSFMENKKSSISPSSFRRMSSENRKSTNNIKAHTEKALPIASDGNKIIPDTSSIGHRNRQFSSLIQKYDKKVRPTKQVVLTNSPNKERMIEPPRETHRCSSLSRRQEQSQISLSKRRIHDKAKASPKGSIKELVPISIGSGNTRSETLREKKKNSSLSQQHNNISSLSQRQIHGREKVEGRVQAKKDCPGNKKRTIIPSEENYEWLSLQQSNRSLSWQRQTYDELRSSLRATTKKVAAINNENEKITTTRSKKEHKWSPSSQRQYCGSSLSQKHNCDKPKIPLRVPTKKINGGKQIKITTWEMQHKCLPSMPQGQYKQSLSLQMQAHDKAETSPIAPKRKMNAIQPRMSTRNDMITPANSKREHNWFSSPQKQQQNKRFSQYRKEVQTKEKASLTTAQRVDAKNHPKALYTTTTREYVGSSKNKWPTISSRQADNAKTSVYRRVSLWETRYHQTSNAILCQ